MGTPYGRIPTRGTNAQPSPVTGNLGTIPYTELLDYVSGTNAIYVGLAAPGSATSSSVWQIRQYTYDGNNNVTAIKYAAGAGLFNQVWDNRAGLSYS